MQRVRKTVRVPKYLIVYNFIIIDHNDELMNYRKTTEAQINVKLTISTDMQ